MTDCVSAPDAPEERKVERITLRNDAQFSMELLSLGATLCAFVLPNGLDVCLGYDTVR